MQRCVDSGATKFVDILSPLVLESGEELGPIRIAYETYGELNKEKDNAILICHALSGDAHAASFHDGDAKPGWWDTSIGPGKAFDTNKFFVICSNVIGGCRGSTGPSSLNLVTGRPYGASFPVVTVKDMVNAQKRLIDGLGITRLHAVAGGSMGGIQALQWAVSYPDSAERAVIIASAGYSTPQQIAFNAVGRRAIITDPAWNNGDYYDRERPSTGLSLARMVGHITYLSDESMMFKFGRGLQNKEKLGFDFSIDFQVESYLDHQGDSFVKRFDPNSYLYLTKAIDYFDLSINGSLTTGLSGVKAKVLVVGISSDWLYPPYQSQEIVSALKANNVDASYGEIHSDYGHDAFLIEGGQLRQILRPFLNNPTPNRVTPKIINMIGGNVDSERTAKQMIYFESDHSSVISQERRSEAIRAIAKPRGYYRMRKMVTHGNGIRA